MNKLNKILLIIVNIIGAIAMITALAAPFIIPSNDVMKLVLAGWMLVTGFVIWYLSIKLLESNPLKQSK